MIGTLTETLLNIGMSGAVIKKLYHPLLKASLVTDVTSQILEGVYVLEQPRIRNSHVQEQTRSL